MSAGFKYVCYGCGAEVWDGDVFPQGEGKYRLYFCRTCNKKYPMFQDRVRTRLASLDAKREEMKEEVRKEVFGSVEAPKPKPEVIKDAAAVDSMRAGLSAGQVIGANEGEGGGVEDLVPSLARKVKSK